VRRPPRFRARHLALGAIVCALPISVETYVPEDSSMTQLRVAGGGSHYLAVMRDCDGNAIDQADGNSYDVGLGIDHKFRGKFMVGVNGGYLHDDRLDAEAFTQDSRGYYFVNPTGGLMGRRFSISLGVAYFSKWLLDPDDLDRASIDDSSIPETEWLPSVAMRIGDLPGFYFTASAFAGLPIYTGGGMVDLGGGFTLSDHSSLWTGISFYGLTATAFEARLQWKLSDRFYSDVGVSIGSREGESQYSGNLGLTYRVIH
jgi:hypothetical protein